MRSVPRVIWSFWSDQSRLPDIVHLAKASWHTFAPGHDIRLLDSKTWDGYVKITPGKGAGVSPSTNDNRFADWLRVNLLADHGGVWIDASIILTAPLNHLVDESAQISGFHLYGMVFETSFIAARKGGATITRWRDEFQKICVMNQDEYDNYLLELKLAGFEALNGQFADCWWGHGSLPRSILEWLFQNTVVAGTNLFSRYTRYVLHPCGELYWMRYLNLHVALNSVIQTSGRDPIHLWHKYGISAQDSGKTLSAVSVLNGMDHERIAEFLVSRHGVGFDLSAVRGLKLRSGDRKVLNNFTVCEEGSIICRIQRLTGTRIMEEKLAGAEALEVTDVRRVEIRANHDL